MNKCYFCNSDEDDVKKLFASEDSNVTICNFCIDILHGELHDNSINSKKININPRSIKDKLDQYIIGQETAKRIVSVAVYNHLLKIHYNLNNVRKGNIILIGPTGNGKTYICEILAKILNVPFTIADATSITSEGYVGENIESIFQPLLNNYAVKDIEKSIICIDECDKKARKTGGNPSITRDVSGEDVQYSLLKLLEGKVVNVQPIGTRKHPHQQYTSINTENILFILCGAFNGLENIIARRLNKTRIGFDNVKGQDNKNLLRLVEHEDLIQFGLIPELVSRIPIIGVLDELNIDDLCQILKEPKDNIIDQYKTLLGADKININFPDETIRKIAETANNKRIGARGLKSVIEKLMMDFMYNVDRNEPKDYDIIWEEK